MAALPASGQSDILSRLETCAELEIESERLACYDGLQVVETESDSTAVSQSGAPPSPPTTSAEAIEEAPETASAAPADIGAPRQAPEPAPAPREDERVTEAAPASDSPESFAVVSIRRNLSGFAVFETEHGDLWIQTDISNRRYPPTPFAARIEPAFLRGNFLRVEESGFRIRVRKVQ
ncbi:MAG: hypothetical protein OXQ29_24940 [Rhodospirillaceae bacterium]|nr:hypothetical protein [Rhodospirillaceae bacterium]